MVKVKIKFSGKKITLRGTGTMAPGFEARDHARLGQVGLRSLRKRVALGVGANDTPMPPLTAGYKKWKRGAKIRNLWLSGKMMLNLSVRWASDRQVLIALTTAKERTKAWSNQQISEWLAWSPDDQRVIMKEAEKIFHYQVKQTGQALINGGRRSRQDFLRDAGLFQRAA